MTKRTTPEYKPASGKTNAVPSPQAQHNQQSNRSTVSLTPRTKKKAELTSETLAAQIAAFKAAGGTVDVIERKPTSLATPAIAE
ncbi:MAG: hypothetical protein HRU20_19660 [Pseudomonadales bacterium]|nr:hypothetical protein [Pseudomonadales bacterium]